MKTTLGRDRSQHLGIDDVTTGLGQRQSEQKVVGLSHEFRDIGHTLHTVHRTRRVGASQSPNPHPKSQAETSGRLMPPHGEGRARMVDVAGKDETERTATAAGSVLMRPETLQLILDGGHKKGDVLAVARLAGIMAAKRTADLIPLCHPLPLSHVDVDLLARDDGYDIEAVARTTAQTGVEMEALTAVAVAALTVYDMVKAVDKTMVIGEIRLMRKTGGRSGAYRRK